MLGRVVRRARLVQRDVTAHGFLDSRVTGAASCAPTGCRAATRARTHSPLAWGLELAAQGVV